MNRILDKFQNTFKTDIRYLLKGGFWLVLGQIAATFLSLILALVFAHLVSKETYGYYKYIISLAGILGAFSLSGINTSLTRSVARGFDYSLIKAFWINLKWSIGIVCISSGLGIYYLLHHNTPLGISMLIIAALTPLINSFSLFDSFLVGKREFRKETIFAVLNNTFTAIAIIATIIITKNVLIIIFVYFCINTLSAALFYYLSTTMVISKNDDPTIFSYGFHLSLMNVLTIIADQIDSILLFHLVGSAQLAIYAYIIAMPEQIKGIFKNISTLALPKFANRTPEEIQKNFYKKSMILGFVILCITILYILTAPFIYKILFPQYSPWAFYSQIYAISLLSSVATLPLSFFQAQGQKKNLYKTNIFGSLIQIGCLLSFIYFYGLLGAIIARVIIRFINTAIAYYVFNKNFKYIQ